MARTKRQIKIEELLSVTETKAVNAVSQLTDATNYLKQTLPFMHNSILQDDGELSLENRSDFSATLDPAFAELLGALAELQQLNAIFSEDAAEYQVNFDNYIALHPDALTNAENLLK